MKLLLAVVIGYAVIASAMYLLQHRLLYLPDVPRRALSTTPRDIGLDYEDVTLHTAVGVAIHGWFVPGGDRVLLFFHGNAGVARGEERDHLRAAYRRVRVGTFRRITPAAQAVFVL